MQEHLTAVKNCIYKLEHMWVNVLVEMIGVKKKKKNMHTQKEKKNRKQNSEKCLNFYTEKKKRIE